MEDFLRRKIWLRNARRNHDAVEWGTKMPVRKIAGGYQWGGHGKKYRGKGAHAKAVKQEIAARYHGYGGGMKKVKGGK